MKMFAFLLFTLIYCVSASAQDSEPKTFLVLFKSKELKEIKTNIKDIESQFSGFFSTKYYAGNSELAMIVEIPTGDFDKCFLGEYLVDLGNGQQVQLQQIAFRLYDLSENKGLAQQYREMYEESLVAKKKASKATRADSQSSGASGH